MTIAHFYKLVTAINIVLFSLLYFVFPSIRTAFTSEDSFMENLSAVFGLESFLFGVILMSVNRRKIHRGFYVIPFMGLLIFLDELSFGERIFGFKFPIFKGVKIDSMHDLLNLFQVLVIQLNKGELSIRQSFAFVFLLILSFGTILYLAYKARRYISFKYLQDVLRRYPPLLFFLAAFFFLFISSILDLHLLEFRGTAFLEELCEMNAALAILFACVTTKALPRQIKKDSVVDA